MKNGVLPIFLKLPINSAHNLAARAHHICQRGILAALSALAFSAGLSGQSLAAAEPKFPDAAAWTLRWGESSGDWLFYPARLTHQSGRFLAGDVHSGDGVTWQKWTLPSDINYWVNSIAAADGTFVLTGAANDLWTSPDGAAWTKRANPGGYDDLMGITFGAGKIVVHRFWSAGSMIVSGDGGQSWTYVDTGGFNYAPGSDSRHYEWSVFGNGRFVFPLFDSVRTSSSGIDWITHTITNRPSSFSMAQVRHYDEESQTFSGVQQTASSSTTKTITTATSADGSQWDFHAAEIATTNSHSYGGGAIGGGLMAISGGSPPDVWVSSDRGRSWSQVAGPWQNTNVTRVALAASDSRLVAALDAGPTGQIYSAEMPASPQAVLYVATTGDDAAGTGSEGSPFATIQKAVAVADAGTTISVGPGNYSGNFTIDKPDLTVRSQQGPAATHIASAARDSVFFVTANGEGAVIDGFTVTGGTGRPQPSSYGFDYYGGAIHAQSSMEVRNCILTGNGAGTPRVDSCTFGGAIYSAGQSDDVVLVENCVLANNFAWASGGASLTERSTIIFDRCTIWGNTSTDFFGNQGGLSAAWSGKIIVRNSILWGNGGSQLGAFGGIYASGTSGELHYSTIQGSVSGGGLAAFAAGEGNLTSDPLLSAPAAGDFTLSANSPARDAGDPSAPLDPDGTRADMGYLSIRFQLAVTQMVYVAGGSLPSSSALVGQSVGDFEIGRTEVTWGEWQLVRGWGAARGYDIVNAGQGSGDNHPVRNVTWYDVVKWCNAKSEMNGLDPVYLLGNGSAYRAGTEIPTIDSSATGFRLPTEREWEWAARGGIMSQGFTYSGSEAVDEVAWYDGNSLQAPVILENGRGSWPVGLKKSNELGLFDMSGNVFEWCWDEDNLRNRYTRGGGWHFYSAPACRVFDRSIARSTGTQNSYTGLRLARSPASVPVPPDTDGDGVNDYREIKDGTDLNDPNSFNPLSKGLVAYYPLDGNVNDESGYANHAVNRGAAVSTDRFGGTSGAYDFNGVDAYMDAPPLVSDYQRNFTMSGWIKTTHVSGDRLDEAVSALSKTRDAGDFGGPAIDFREGKAIFTFNNNRVYGDLVPFEEWDYATEELLADGNWRHYIMSIDADGLITAFINGQPVASHQITTFLEVTGAAPFQIGRAGGLHAAARYFPGQIDEVRVYNRGLTAEEAAMLYRESVCGLDSDADGVTDYRENRDGTDPYDVSSFEPLSVALIANYPFDSSWKDESGYCRDVLAPYTTFEPGLLGSSLGLAEGNSQANYWNDPNNIESPGRINNFTFSVWMKPATLEQADGAWYHLVSAPNNAAYLRIGNAVGTPGAKVLGMGYSWSGIPGFDYSTPALTSLQESFWQHVVGVQQGVSTAIYVNGRLVGSMENGQEILFDPENFTIGNLFNKDTFQGQLDEVRIYGRALSPAEVAALYALEVGDLDSDNDGLHDVYETNTGTFVSATDAGTDPYNPDTSGDGILDGEAVLWNFNPLTDHSQVLAFLRHATGVQSGRFGLFTEGSIMDLNLGGVMIQKTGNQASVRFKVESKMDLRDASWTDRGTYLLPPLEMPGSKGFLRIRAEQH